MSVSKKQPKGGVDYPVNWGQYLDWFRTEQGCRSYLEKLRWSEGLVCPQCSLISQAQSISRARLICPSCKHQSTATAGTIFEKTRTQLRVWFAAIWCKVFIKVQPHPPMNPCQVYTVWRPCCSVGCWAHTKGPCSPSNWRTTWMNLYFASTAGHLACTDCCSIDCLSRPF